MGTENDKDDMRDEYDFTGGVRGKYAGQYAEGQKFVALDKDVAAIFPDADSVNRALRSLAGIIRDATDKPVHQ